MGSGLKALILFLSVMALSKSMEDSFFFLSEERSCRVRSPNAPF
jgi:hypothetical protein